MQSPREDLVERVPGAERPSGVALLLAGVLRAFQPAVRVTSSRLAERDTLTPSGRDKRMRLLSSPIGKTRCRAALDLCHAAWAGTDIASAVPELAKVADLPHSADLDAMWAQHALQAAAFCGADLRPALPALLGKLKSHVDQYAIDALRTWAS